MEEPKYILTQGVQVLTHGKIDGTAGLLVRQDFLNNRRTNAKATIHGPVAGHGGDIYWAKHEDNTVAVYGWWEFELVAPEPAQKSFDFMKEMG